MNGLNWPPPGSYIVAVSGGADSMTLLDLLATAPHDYHLVVAHFDHGLRPDASADAAFVKAAAQRYGLPFETRAGHLGRASEATARAARHAWLQEVRGRHQAAAVLTAHHQDDRLETSLLNLARGSGRLGLAPMAPDDGPIQRPLLGVARAKLREYAAGRHLSWREDPTNQDLSNPRNFLRHRLMPAAPPGWRDRYVSALEALTSLNNSIDSQTATILAAARTGPETFSFDRPKFRAYTPLEAAEVILAATRALRPGLQIDRRSLHPAVTLALSGRTGTGRTIRRDVVLMLTLSHISVTTNRDL